MNVEQMMNRGAVACRSHETLQDAARKMWERDLGFLTVVDEHGRLIGTITDRDICMAAFTRGIRLNEATVDSVMAKTVQVCQATDPVSRAEQLMIQNQLHRLPVVDEAKRPIGVVTVADLAKLAADRPSAGGVSCEEVARTLREVCPPRAARPGQHIAASP
jgi:CBS domain-containing protein